MRKKYGRLLALWSLAALLMTGLLSGCGSGMQNDRQNGSMAPSAAVSETDGREQTAGGDTDGTAVQAADGETDETARTTADETDRPLRTADRETAAETEPNEERGKAETEPAGDEAVLPEEGSYTSKEDVALYLYTYGHLPDNFVTKNEAKKLGWDNAKGNLAEVAPGKSIGGDRFGNYEGLLPEEDGRKWTECDIGYEEGYRNGERIVFSNDGLIYYTGDHYKSFEQLY